MTVSGRAHHHCLTPAYTCRVTGINEAPQYVILETFERPIERQWPRGFSCAEPTVFQELGEHCMKQASVRECVAVMRRAALSSHNNSVPFQERNSFRSRVLQCYRVIGISGFRSALRSKRHGRRKPTESVFRKHFPSCGGKPIVGLRIRAKVTAL